MINEARGATFTLTLATPVVKDSSGGTKDYNELINKPSINGVEMRGELSLDDLGIQPAGDYPHEAISDEELEEILQ